MAPFKLDNILIIYPKSETTLLQFGLNDETFTIPEFEIPTKIYKSIDNDNQYFSTPEYRTHEICPIRNGSIVNLNAFLQFLKLVYGSILSKIKNNNNTSSNDNNTFLPDLTNIPILIISNYSWTNFQIEKIVQFSFEHLKFNNLFILPNSLATTYALISQPNSIVIDIGAKHTDIVPVIDYISLNHIAYKLKFGGDHINKTLQNLLPQFDEETIEILKKSSIFEVVNDDMKKLHNIGILNNNNNNGSVNGNNDDLLDGSLNIVDIVTSNRDTREILAEREKLKNEKHKNVKNTDLEFNTFWDQHGNELSVGKERFQGCDDLIMKISEMVGFVMQNVQDINKVKLAWDNIIITGATSSIEGFKEGLLAQLIKDHLIIEPEDERNRREKELLDSLPHYKRNRNKFMDSSIVPTVEYNQVPNSIKLAKYPEYFPNWKKHGYAEIPFLGAQIVAKQIFTHSRDVLYITREKYEEIGPSCIWDIQL